MKCEEKVSAFKDEDFISIHCPLEDEPTAILDTFPDNDDLYHKVFEIPKDYLIEVLESMDGFNNCEGVELERFYQEYIWDETEVIYNSAKKNGKIVSEWSE